MSTINLETFLTLLDKWGHTSSAELVANVLVSMGWGDKDAFTKDDVLKVMEVMTKQTQERLVNEPDAFQGSTAAEREHMGALLAAVTDHALPMLREESQPTA